MQAGDAQGLAAVAEVVGPDGVLSAEGAAQLQRTPGLFANLRTTPDPDGQTRAVQSLTMVVKGLNAALAAELERVGELGMPKPDAVQGLVRRTQHLAAQLDGLKDRLPAIGLDGEGVPKARSAALAHADPKAVHDLAYQVGTLGGYANEMAEQLSAIREGYGFDSGDRDTIAQHKKLLTASEQTVRQAWHLGMRLGDRAQYMRASALNPADGAPPDAQVVRAMEKTFPGIHDPFYGCSAEEVRVWNEGGPEAFIAHLLGR